MYDPLIGRFLSADPTIPDVANPQALNRYSYVYNRPTVLIDPSGYAPEWPDPNGGGSGDKNKNSLACITNPASCSGPPPMLEKNQNALVVAPAQVEVVSGPGGTVMAKGSGSGIRQKIRDVGDKIGMALGGCKGLVAILCSEAARRAAEKAAELANADGDGGANEVNAGINAVDKLINAAGKLEQVSGAKQGFVKGNAMEIYQGLIKGAEHIRGNLYKLADGTYINYHKSTSTGVSTIDINRAGEIFKIRVTP
jgi:hypothetical protein